MLTANYIDGFIDLFGGESTSHPIDLPQFPALTSLRISFPNITPSAELIDILSSISSSPVLAFITLEWLWPFSFESNLQNYWDHLDGFLSQMAKNTTVRGGLVLTFARWQGGSAPEVLLPKFRKVGKIVIDPFNPKILQRGLRPTRFRGSTVSHDC